MAEECWKDIPDFPGYEISNQGRIRRIHIYSYQKLYRDTIVLSKDNIQYHRSIKKLMAELFKEE